MQVDVRAGRAQEDARHATQEELRHEREGPQHGCGECDGAAVERGDVDEEHLRDRNGDDERGDREQARHARVDAGDELVVRPHEEADDAGRDRRVDDGPVGEELLAGEGDLIADGGVELVGDIKDREAALGAAVDGLRILPASGAIRSAHHSRKISRLGNASIMRRFIAGKRPVPR